MGKVMRRLTLGLVLAVAVPAALWGLSRWVGPSDAQEAAMATMRPLPPLQGRNAFPALWLMPYAVPAGREGAVFAEDLRRIGTAGPPAPDAGRPFDSVARARYGDAIEAETMARFCRNGADCLSAVEADPEAFAALVTRHAALLDRIEGLSAYGGIRQSFGYDASAPLPAYQYGRLPMTRHALLFVQGRRDEAFDGVCRGVSTWRRLGAHSDSLIARLIGAAFAGEGYARLFAEMLARVPRDHPLPPSCAQAFVAPAGVELSICDAMRGEYRFHVAAIRAVRDDPSLFAGGTTSGLPLSLMPVLFDERMSEADSAQTLGRFCAPEMARDIAEDRPIAPDAAPQGYLRLQCIGNAVGCLLNSIATPLFADYPARVQDANARIRLIGALLRLRAEAADESTFARRLRAAQAEIGSDARRIEIVDGGRSLRMSLFSGARDGHWTIPLPPDFADAGAAP